MKSVDLFCASPASTAICSSMDMVRQGGIRPIDHQQRRHSHRLGDHHHRHKTKPKTTPIIPCSSQIPISPKPYFEKFRKSTSSSTTPKLNLDFLRRKSSADINDLSNPPTPTGNSSSRYLLSDTPLLLDLLSSDDLPQHNNSSSTMVVPRQPMKNINTSKKNYNFVDYPVFRSSSLSSYSYDNPVFESSSSSSSPSLRSNVDSHAQKSSSLSRFNPAQKSPSLSSRVQDHDDFHVRKSSLSRTTSASHATKSSSLACPNESHVFNKSGRPRDQVRN